MGSCAFVDARSASWQSTAARLADSPPFTLEKDIEIAHHVSFQQIIDGSGQIFLARRMVAEDSYRRFGEGLLKIRMADLPAGGAITLPRRFLGACD